MTAIAAQAATEHAPEADDTKFLGHPQLNPVLGNGAFYTMQGCAAGAVGICFLLFSRKINALMGDVR